MIKPLYEILVTNDDGIRAMGINKLVDELKKIANITVIAPDQPRSGASSQITTSLPVSLKKVSEEDNLICYRCNGTPVDCVKLALNTIFAWKRPDLIISGINHGRNDGICIFYSGTVGSALEGAISGIPSIAFSNFGFDAIDEEFNDRAIKATEIVKILVKSNLNPRRLINVNFPKGISKGIKVCSQATGRFIDEYFESTNAINNKVYWMKGYQIDPDKKEDTDLYWLERGYTTITPIHLDLTDYGMLDKLRQSLEEETN